MEVKPSLQARVNNLTAELSARTIERDKARDALGSVLSRE